MKVLQDQGFCTCCGNYAEYKFGQENYSMIDKNLENYKKYKDIYVFKCSKCGFASTDITCVEGVLSGEILKTYEFKQLLECSFLNGINYKLPNDYTEKVPVGMYEAYSQILLDVKDYEKYIRIINWVIELKEILKINYMDLCEEFAESDGNETDYKELFELIDKSIDSNRQQIDYYFGLLENKNVFITLIYIENMIALGKKAEATVLLKEIKDKKRLEDDLIEFFKQKIEN